MYDYDADLEWNRQRLRRLSKNISDLQYSIMTDQEELHEMVADAELLVKQIREEERG